MKLPDLFIVFGIFLIIFTLASMFLSDFNINIETPSRITQAWTDTYNQIEKAKASVDENYQKIKKGGIEAVAGVFGLAFSGIFYIIVSLWGVLISIPSSVTSAISYISSVLGIPSEISTLITAIIIVIIVIKMIEFVTGRYFT